MSNRPETEEQAILSVARKFDPSLSCPGSMDKLSAWRRLCLAVESFMSGGGGGAAPVTIVDQVSGDDSTAQRRVSSKPYQTVKAAVDDSQPDDYIFVNKGVYNEENMTIPHNLSLEFASGSFLIGSENTGNLFTVTASVANAVHFYGFFQIFCNSDGFIFDAESCIHVDMDSFSQLGNGGASRLHGSANESTFNFRGGGAFSQTMTADAGFVIEGGLNALQFRGGRLVCHTMPIMLFRGATSPQATAIINVDGMRVQDASAIVLESAADIRLVDTDFRLADSGPPSVEPFILFSNASGNCRLQMSGGSFQGGTATVTCIDGLALGGTNELRFSTLVPSTHIVGPGATVEFGNVTVDASWEVITL